MRTPAAPVEDQPSSQVVISSPSELNALEDYTGIEQKVYVHCPSCTNLDALHCLETVEALFIDAPALTTMSGLANLTEVSGKLAISTEVLTSLTGLEALTSVGSLQIQDNDGLTAIDGLGTLTVTDELIIDAHLNLADVSGLSGISHSGYFVLFRYNFDLPTCDALSIVEQFQNAGFTGDVCVKSNQSDGCFL